MRGHAEIMLARPGNRFTRVLHLGEASRQGHAVARRVAFEERQHRGGVAPPDPGLIVHRCGRLPELLERKRPHRLEQAIARRILVADDDQRTVGQRGQPVDDLPARAAVVGHQRHCELEREPARKHTQRAKQPLFGGAQQAEAPLERVVQRAVAQRCVAVPTREQRKALVQRVVHALQAEQRHTRGHHFERERQAIELCADGAQQGQLRRRHDKALIGSDDAFEQQRQRTLPGAGKAGDGGLGPGQGQRLEPQNLLAGHGQRHQARHEQQGPVQRAQQRGQFGAGLGKVLGVVQHQQQRLIAQRRHQLRSGKFVAAAELQLQGLRHRAGHLAA